MTVSVRFVLASALLLATADPAAAQYRRQVEELPPLFGIGVSIGALLEYEETLTPVETPLPTQDRRALRTVGTHPAVTVAARYGRGLAIYGSLALGFAPDAEMSGTNPLTGATVTGTEDTGLVTIGSIGLSFIPLPDLLGLRLEVGPSWVDLGEGGSYIGVRVAGAAKFLELGDRAGVLLGWDGYFAGGQYDRDRVEYQIRGGMLSSVRLGVELEY
jgi:hypothetical protein